MPHRSLLRPSLAAFVVCALALAGCAGQQPEPTIGVAPEVKLIAEVTGVIETPAVQELLELPNVVGRQLPTLDADAPDLPTVTAEAISSPRPAATGRIFGAIIDADYQMPPTSTARLVEAAAETPLDLQSPQPRIDITTPLPLDDIRLDGSRMGIQVHYNFDVAGWDRTLRQIAALRMGWIKLQASWEWMQPDFAGQFEENFRLFQLHVQEADKRGNKVMLSIAKAPDWARNVNRNEDGPPDDLNQLAAFIGLLLEKLGPYIDAIEIWNEPNLKREWTGQATFDGAGYMELFRVGYNAIRAYSPNITVITAGLAPTGNSQNISVNDRSFLRQMYQAGLASFPDVVIGIHPYSWGNPPDFVCCNNVNGQGWDDQPQFFFSQNIRDYSEIIRANGHDAKMWATEFGWATWEGYPTDAPDPWMYYNTALNQRDYSLRAFQIAQSRADIGVMILWNLSFAEELTIFDRSELAGYSLLYPSFDGNNLQLQRPLYQALVERR
ncbi:MAG: cellulase family glycosylhydrolase [Chloroflexota bacterium]|nr:cellulase family glycosylhydrolase [Chloroflexota bacterium]